MKTKHDYTAASTDLQLGHFETASNGDEVFVLKRETVEAITSALQIAHAVTQEPSDGMFKAADEAFWSRDNGRQWAFADIFKAMRDKMLEEIE